MGMLKVSVVCCDDTESHLSQIVEMEIEAAEIEQRVVETVDQRVAANEAREMHNAAHHAEHGPVTYLQQVNEGGFSVLVGEPGNLDETFFGPGSLVGFMDDKGPGHASRVGPDGTQRTLRILKGHLK